MVNNFTLFQALTHTHTLESRKRQDTTLTRASTLQVAEGDGGGSALRVSNSSAQRSSTSGRAAVDARLYRTPKTRYVGLPGALVR